MNNHSAIALRDKAVETVKRRMVKRGLIVENNFMISKIVSKIHNILVEIDNEIHHEHDLLVNGPHKTKILYNKRVVTYEKQSEHDRKTSFLHQLAHALVGFSRHLSAIKMSNEDINAKEIYVVEHDNTIIKSINNQVEEHIRLYRRLVSSNYMETEGKKKRNSKK